MLKLFEEILPLIDYSLSAQWYPDNTESKEYLPLENTLETTPYADFTSSIYDNPNPCEVINKKPLYTTPQDMNFSKAYMDWLLLKRGVERKDFKAKRGQIKRILLLQFDLTLPLIPKYMYGDYWLNNIKPILIPTHYVDMETGKYMCFKFQSLILTKYAISINTRSANHIKCTVFGYDPDIVFLDKLPVYSDFENWISKEIEVYSAPDNISLVSNNIVFSITVDYSSNISFMSYKKSTQLKDIQYLYIPNINGTFERKHGFITLSNYPVQYDAYDWVLIQSQPQFQVQVDIFDPNYKLTQTSVTKFQIHFKNDNLPLGSIHIYVTDFSCDKYHVQLSGIGHYIPGDV